MSSPSGTRDDPADYAGMLPSPCRGRREHGALRSGWYGFRPCRSPASSTRARWRLLCCTGEGASERAARVFRRGCDGDRRVRPLVRRPAPGASASRRRVITGKRSQIDLGRAWRHGLPATRPFRNGLDSRSETAGNELVHSLRYVLKNKAPTSGPPAFWFYPTILYKREI